MPLSQPLLLSQQQLSIPLSSRPRPPLLILAADTGDTDDGGVATTAVANGGAGAGAGPEVGRAVAPVPPPAAQPPAQLEDATAVVAAAGVVAAAALDVADGEAANDDCAVGLYDDLDDSDWRSTSDAGKLVVSTEAPPSVPSIPTATSFQPLTLCV